MRGRVDLAAYARAVEPALVPMDNPARIEIFDPTGGDDMDRVYGLMVAFGLGAGFAFIIAWWLS